MLLTRDQLEPLLPHAGAMLMIDSVEAFDEERISCLSERHQAADNPLCCDGRLAALHGIEFAAQTAAIHGGLLSKERKAPLRVLAAVRNAHFSRPWFDGLPGPLRIVSTIVMLDQQAAVYQASVTHLATELATMRLTLMTIGPELPS